MAQTAELSATLSGFEASAPKPVVSTITKARTDFAASYDPSTAIQPGAALPSFTLNNALGKPISSASLLSKGPLLITFYRGSWCPFCNIALHHLQANLGAYAAKGVQLVAITPELPDTTLSTVEKEGLGFTVLSDVGNGLARELGIVFKQPEEMRGVFKQFGNDLEKRNGDASLEVPVPATLLVDAEGVVRNTFVEADYTQRVEPQETLRWIDAL